MSQFVTRQELAQRDALLQSQLGAFREMLARTARAAKVAKSNDGVEAAPAVDHEQIKQIAEQTAARTLAGMRLPKDGVSVRGDVGPTGEPGPRGPIGLTPRHEWSGTELRFEQAPGQWGKYVDLQGPAGKDGRTHTSFSVVNEGGGSGGTSDGSVPYYVAPTEIFRVPLYRQALFARTIEVRGYIELRGDLIMVS